MSTLTKELTNQRFESIWDALGDSPAEAENLKVKAKMMAQIVKFMKAKKLTQVEAARLCHVTQPRMSDLLNGRISKFSLDALVNIATAAGLTVELEVVEA